jgi:hypothetical protein
MRGKVFRLSAVMGSDAKMAVASFGGASLIRL